MVGPAVVETQDLVGMLFEEMRRYLADVAAEDNAGVGDLVEEPVNPLVQPLEDLLLLARPANRPDHLEVDRKVPIAEVGATARRSRRKRVRHIGPYGFPSMTSVGTPPTGFTRGRGLGAIRIGRPELRPIGLLCRVRRLLATHGERSKPRSGQSGASHFQ